MPELISCHWLNLSLSAEWWVCSHTAFWGYVMAKQHLIMHPIVVEAFGLVAHLNICLPLYISCTWWMVSNLEVTWGAWNDAWGWKERGKKQHFKSCSGFSEKPLFVRWEKKKGRKDHELGCCSYSHLFVSYEITSKQVGNHRFRQWYGEYIKLHF